MKKILNLVLPLSLILILSVFGTFSVFASEAAEEDTVPASVGATEETSAPTESVQLETPEITDIYSIGRNITIVWDSVPGAYKYRVFCKTDKSWRSIGETESNGFVWSSAELNKEYIYTVRCIDENGKYCSEYNKTGYSYKAVLASPKLTGASVSKGDINITWEPVEGAEKYRVFFKGGNQKGWKKIADVTGVSYSWNGGEYNTEYTFTVRCVGNSGSYESGFDSAGVKCRSKVSMSKISSIKASGTSAVITWNAVPDTCKYRVFYKNGSSWKAIGVTDKTSYTYKGAELGKSMTYTVRCINSAGKYISAFDSAGYKFTLNLATPEIKSVATQGLNSAKITWNKVSGAAKYRVFYKNGSSWKKIGDTANTYFTVNKMDPKTTYIFTVRCISSKGSYESLFNKAGYSHRNYLTEVPEITGVKKADDSSVSISHSIITGITKYRLYYKGGSQSGWKVIDNTASNPYTWKYVEPNETLTYTVRCLAPNGDVISDFNPSGYKYSLASSKLQTPKITSVIYAGGKVTVKWNAVAKASNYSVRTSSDGGSTWKRVGTTGKASFTYTASPNTSLLYSVVCLDSGGNIVSSYDTAKITEIEFDAPVLERSSSVIKFSWKAISGVEKYEIYRNCYKTSGYQYYKTVSGSAKTFEDTSVEEGRAYYYKVKAVFDGGAVTCTSKPLKTVAGLCAPGTSITSRLRRFNIDWNGISFAKGYDIFYSTDNKNFTLLETTDRWFCNTKRLTSGKKYYFRIRPYKYVNGEKVVGTYKAVSGTCTANAYGSYVGNTYIEVSKNQQYMWVYVNGDLKVETSVVTGNYGTADTPSGFHKIWQIESPATLVGADYVTPVDYWMAFTYDGCGIHDATWRSSFGGNIYKGDGSHGCVNTPYSKVKAVYSYAYIGMPVIVYP